MVFSIFATSNSIEHMKSFNPQPWLLPQPVLILGTYNTEGKPNAMNVAWAGTWNMKQIVISLGNHQTFYPCLCYAGNNGCCRLRRTCKWS